MNGGDGKIEILKNKFQETFDACVSETNLEPKVMSEVMKVDDDNIAELKSPSIGAADEFFDAVDDGENFHNNNHRRIVAVNVWRSLLI